MIKNIKNMHAVSMNQIADILHFNDENKVNYLKGMVKSKNKQK